MQRIPKFALVLASFARVAAGQTPPAIELEVDARQAPQRLIHVHETVPVLPGPLTLFYPKWIPGEHGPTGPIADVVNLRIRAGQQAISWKRDSTDLFAFQLTAPADATALDIEFDFISPPEAGGFSAGASMTTELAVLSWNQFLLYPQGASPDRLRFHARLRLPRDWRYGTALDVAKENSGQIEFQPVTLTTLIDSPVAAGAHVKTVDLGTAAGAAHDLHIVADSEHALEIPSGLEQHYKALVREAVALFGARHYRAYHFLLTLSDHVASFGLEHHESSDDRLEERFLLEENSMKVQAELLAHEFTHSWNGKYRRPAGLATRDYQEPMKGDLLWVYEGLTEYLGYVLAARSGINTVSQFRDELAGLGAHFDHESGRAWRPLSDTAISAQILYGAREDYADLRRGTDFYGEAALLWLEVDTLLRRLSGGSKSIDDFCKAFHGGTSGAPEMQPYALEEMVSTLNAVQPHDWAAFFHERVETVERRAPLAGITNAGWKLTYDAKRPEMWTAEEEQHKLVDLELSLGIIVRNEGGVQDVVLGGPAQKAGISPSARITTVNGRQFSPAILREAVQAAADKDQPIEIVVKNGEYFSTHTIDYFGGEKYPHLVRETGEPDLLELIAQPRAGR